MPGSSYASTEIDVAAFQQLANRANVDFDRGAPPTIRIGKRRRRAPTALKSVQQAQSVIPTLDLHNFESHDAVSQASIPPAENPPWAASAMANNMPSMAPSAAKTGRASAFVRKLEAKLNGDPDPPKSNSPSAAVLDLPKLDEERVSPDDGGQSLKAPTLRELVDQMSGMGDSVAMPEDWQEPQNPADERLEKQRLLIELNNLTQKGVILTRQYSMNDRVFEIRAELEQQQDSINCRNTVGFMRDTMFMGFSMLEMANKRFGPFLAIDGWSASLTRDKERFNTPLERIYKKYWRKAQMNPIVELGWLIIGSMVVYHFQNKFLGGTPSSQTSEEVSSNSVGPSPSHPPPRPSQQTQQTQQATQPDMPGVVFPTPPPERPPMVFDLDDDPPLTYRARNAAATPRNNRTHQQQPISQPPQPPQPPQPILDQQRLIESIRQRQANQIAMATSPPHPPLPTLPQVNTVEPISPLASISSESLGSQDTDIDDDDIDDDIELQSIVVE